MGIDHAYFTAPDDAAAAEAEQRPGGPLGWPTVVATRRTGLFRKEAVVESLGPAYDGFSARGYDPVSNLGTLEALLRDVEYDVLLDDPRLGSCPGEGDSPDGGVVQTVTDTLRDVLADADDHRLRWAAQAWAETEELRQPWWADVTLEDHVQFLQQLRRLARTARDRGHRLYCYVEE